MSADRAHLRTLQTFQAAIILILKAKPKLALLLLMLFATFTDSFAEPIKCYDCLHKEARFNEIDLTEPQECPDPETDYKPVVQKDVQVIHIAQSSMVVAISCQAMITKKVTRCGYDSLNYGSTYSAYKKNVWVTPEECRKAYDERHKPEDQARFITIGNRRLRYAMWKWVTEHYFSYGHRDDEGNCEYTTFTSEGRLFKKSYEEVFLEVRVIESVGRADQQTGEVYFRNGVRGMIKDGVLRDDSLGTLVWTQPEVQCMDSKGEVYHGMATIKERKGRSGMEEAIVMIHDTDTNQYAGLVLRSPMLICRHQCYTTHLGEGLAVCILEQDEHIDIPEAGKQFDIQERNIQTQISYLHLDLRLKFYKTWTDVEAEICGLDRRTLYGRLQEIGDTNNPYALNDIFGPGHTIQRAGAVAYVTQCVKVWASTRSSANCSHDIPVHYNNQTMYVDPITLVLKNFGNIIECNTIQPVKWKIDGHWKVSTPAVSRTHAPSKLNLTYGTIQYPQKFADGLGRGLYTDQQLAVHRKFVAQAETRQAVVTKLTNAAVANAQGGSTLGLPLSSADIPDLTAIMTWNIFPLAYWFGDAWHWVSGAILMVGTFKIIIGSMYRALMMYRKRGCGWWMFSAIWATGFMIIMYPIELVAQAIDAVQNPPDPLPGEHEEARELNRRNEYEDLEAQLAEMRKAQAEMIARYDQMFLERYGHLGRENHPSDDTAPPPV